MWRILQLAALIAAMNAAPSLAANRFANVAKCNAKSASSTEAADLPGYLADMDQPADSSSQPAETAPAASPSAGPSDRRQDWSIDLGKDLDSLSPIAGVALAETPVLLLRLENLPKFDPRRHCNRVFPILGKPAIERLADGRVRASLARYSISFLPSAPTAPWLHDTTDRTGRIFWIFPRLFGRTASGPWQLTTAYATAFASAPSGSLRRSWLAETYLDLAMRVYWDNALSLRFPIEQPPPRITLNRRVIQRTGVDCAIAKTDVFCLSALLIELNENGTPARRLSRSAFRTSDAVYESSGLTVGLQQLDIAVDKQAKRLLPRWMPSTIGRVRQYRRKIRLWTIDDLNRWYFSDADRANAELARPTVRDQIVDSFIDRMIDTKRVWEGRVLAAYPSWSNTWRAVIAMIAIDLENVSGYRLYLPSGARNVCDVLTSQIRRPNSIRDNATFLEDPQISLRYRNARIVVGEVPTLSDADLSCIHDPRP